MYSEQNNGFSPETYGAAVNAAKTYTDAALANFPKGINYKGSVNYYGDLPNNAEEGDAYTVKYTGSSGTDADGTEYAWGKDNNVFSWIALGADMSQYQKLLVSGVNINTVNGQSLLGSGNLVAGTYQTFPAGWTTDSTTAAFCAAVNSDATAVAGCAYLGELYCSDLPASIVNAEAVVEVVDGTGTSGKTIHIVITSGNVSPYRWEYTYWDDGSHVSGWIAFETTANKVTSISALSTDAQYPSAKCVYDIVGNIETLLAAI